MATKTLAQRYVGRILYAGDLMDDPTLDWLRHEEQPRGLAFPCFLPECRKLLMRTARGRQAYYCPGHARIALNRQRQLAAKIHDLQAELDGGSIGVSGRESTRRGRRLQADLDFLTRMLASYAPASSEDLVE